MIVKNVRLKNFRNFGELDVALGGGVNILSGANAQGKTNFLESVYFSATGRSKRAHSDKELIMFGAREARIQVLINKDQTNKNDGGYTDKIDVQINKDAGKGIAVNGLPVKRLSELFGSLLAVIFTPEDLAIVKAGPSERRKFIDMELCQTSAVYYYELQQYYKVLKQRNALLFKIKNNKDLKSTVFIWDEQLCEHGAKLFGHRKKFIETINVIAGEIHSELTDGNEKLEIIYKPCVSPGDFIDKLKKNIDRDIAAGSTQIGPHKDDAVFLINGLDARTYASQGQQRTASLSAKLSEIRFIEHEKNQTPILLLDDVLSELDKRRQKQLLEKINDIQAIITCTGADDILARYVGGANVYSVKNGAVTAENV